MIVLYKFKLSKLYLLTSIFLFLTLVSCDVSFDKKGFSIDGFKEIKFGLNANELINLGIKCNIISFAPEVCDMSNSAKTKFTLFGQKTRLYVKTSDNKVAKIRVYIEHPPSYLIEKFTVALGSPTIYNYLSGSGHNINKYYWVSKNGTSIAVTKNLDVRQDVGFVKFLEKTYMMKNETSADYLDQTETTKSLKLLPPLPVKNDF